MTLSDIGKGTGRLYKIISWELINQEKSYNGIFPYIYFLCNNHEIAGNEGEKMF